MRPGPESASPGVPPGTVGQLLVTGCYRSGTTLLEKLLHQLPRVSVASQPTPDFYFLVKARFDAEHGVQRVYPLDHLFRQTTYRRGELTAWLDEARLERGDIEAVFDSMARNEMGLWTPEMLGFRERIEPGPVLQVFRAICAAVASLYPKPDLAWSGGKEILIEEWIPFFLSHGVRVVVVVRDPRDMITSLDFRERDNLTGADRPVLYSLRAWRKSVAYVLAHEGEPGFAWLRYEDLVRDPEERVNRIAEMLGEEPLPAGRLAAGLTDQRGEPWAGNSAFADQERVARSPVGRYRERLPRAVTELVEAACRPEMLALGYLEGKGDLARHALESYADPFAEVHASFAPDYSADPARIAQELERYERLAKGSPASAEETEEWFLFPRAYERLARAVRTGAPS